jgi:hypothetical protein
LFLFSFSFSLTFTFPLTFSFTLTFTLGVLLGLRLPFVWGFCEDCQSFFGLHHRTQYSHHFFQLMYLILLASICGLAIMKIEYAIGSTLASGIIPNNQYQMINLKALSWFTSGRFSIASRNET